MFNLKIFATAFLIFSLALPDSLFFSNGALLLPILYTVISLTTGIFIAINILMYPLMVIHYTVLKLKLRMETVRLIKTILKMRGLYGTATNFKH